jgi:hypothetical protein
MLLQLQVNQQTITTMQGLNKSMTGFQSLMGGLTNIVTQLKNVFTGLSQVMIKTTQAQIQAMAAIMNMKTSFMTWGGLWKAHNEMGMGPGGAPTGKQIAVASSISELENIQKMFEKFPSGDGTKPSSSTVPKMKDDFWTTNLAAAGNGLKSIAFPLRAIAPKTWNAMGDAIKNVGSMGPQMAAIAIVTAPLQAALEGFLEPLQPLTDIFGAFGEVLGTMLLPVVNMLVPILTPLIPTFQSLANTLAPFVTLIASTMLIPLGLLSNLLQMAKPYLDGLTASMKPFTDLIQQFTTAISTEGFLGALTDMGSKILDCIWGGISAGLSWLGNMISNWWQNLTNGGLDQNKSTWW